MVRIVCPSMYLESVLMPVVLCSHSESRLEANDISVDRVIAVHTNAFLEYVRVGVCPSRRQF